MKKLTILLPALFFISLACFAGDNRYNDDNPTIGGSINTALIGGGIMLTGYLISRYVLSRVLGQGLMIIGGLAVFVGVVQVIGIIVAGIENTLLRIAIIISLFVLGAYILRHLYYSTLGRHSQRESS